jgi:hypothetical protein
MRSSPRIWTQTPALCLLTLLASTSPAGAATRMRYQPEQTHANVPFEVVLAADFEFALVEQPVVGETYRVVTRRTGVSTPGALASSLTLRVAGPSSTDAHFIEWWDRPAAGAEVLLERVRIDPYPELRLEAPDVVTDQDPVALTVSGAAPCPHVNELLEGYDGGVIAVAYSYGCVPGGPLEPFVETTEALTLPAGHYRLVLRDISDFPYLVERPLTVLPTEVKLQGERFAIDLRWDDGITTGKGRVTSMPGPDSAVFYFFDPSNWEFLVKVLDGCAINGHYWVFGAASTAVGYTLTVTDLERPELAPRVHTNALGTPAAAITDIVAFPCVESNP